MPPPKVSARQTHEGRFGSTTESDLYGNCALEFPVCNSELGSNRKVQRVMDNDADRFRQYATECRRLADGASEKDKTVLMEIAAAWIVCAEEAERKQHAATKHK
jgi:hypothetical protein